MTKDTLNVAWITTNHRHRDCERCPGRGGYYGKIANDKTALLRVASGCEGRAGRCGCATRRDRAAYAIHRWLTDVAGVTCEVVAPSLTRADRAIG